MFDRGLERLDPVTAGDLWTEFSRIYQAGKPKNQAAPSQGPDNECLYPMDEDHSTFPEGLGMDGWDPSDNVDNLRRGFLVLHGEEPTDYAPAWYVNRWLAGTYGRFPVADVLRARGFTVNDHGYFIREGRDEDEGLPSPQE